MKSFVQRIEISCLICLILLSGCTSTPISDPVKLNVQRIDEGILLTWDEVERADSYRIYRKKIDDLDYKYICDVTDSEYVDIPFTENHYLYKVTALSEQEESDGVISEEIPYMKEKTQIELTQPIITSVTSMDQFTNVLLFEDDNQDCSYEIYRSLDGTRFELAGLTDEKVFYDTNANQLQYYYQVKAIQDESSSDVSIMVQTGTNKKEVIGIPIFMYHEFVTQEDLDEGVLFDEYAIYREEFESDLIWLKENGYTTITTQQLADYLEGKAKLPKKPVILTIDDGKLGVYKHAYPLLKEYDMKAALAVIGEEIDKATNDPEARMTSQAPYSTWEEIKEMSDSGTIEIISHSYYLHRYEHGDRQGANSADHESSQDFFLSAKNDSDIMQKKLEEVVGKKSVALSYPYSIRSEVSDETWLDIGYKILLAGHDDETRKTYLNYFIQEAGINSKSALTGRIVRFHGTSISTYIKNAITLDQQ